MIDVLTVAIEVLATTLEVLPERLDLAGLVLTVSGLGALVGAAGAMLADRERERRVRRPELGAVFGGIGAVVAFAVLYLAQEIR